MAVINLTKGQKINLKKENGTKLERLCLGANWGAIEKKGWLGGKKLQAVDLDASIGVFAQDGTLLEKIYFANETGTGIQHSGDDRVGDVGGDDGLDNEVIMIDLTRVHPNAAFIGMVLNSYNHIDFGDIPFASIRIYEGTPSRVDNVFAKFEITNDSTLAGKVAMILGGIYKHNGEWKFNSIGQGTEDRSLDALLGTCRAYIKK